MDWFEDIETNIWLFPRGMKRDGAVGENSAQWVSKYGSLGAAGFDVGTTDGLNEKGLMANLLYLGEADFGERDVTRPGYHGLFIPNIFWTISQQSPRRLRR